MSDSVTSTLLESVVAAATSAAATAAATGAENMAADEAEMAPPPCPTANEFNGDLGLRISAVFVILVGSMLGAVFPVWARNNRHLKVPSWAFFVAKYFGSGVIIATAFIHLLAPANEALTNPCLTGPITEYAWAEGIVLMSIFVLFFVELMAMRYSVFDPTHEHAAPPGTAEAAALALPGKHEGGDVERQRRSSGPHAHTPGEDHLGHSREHAGEDEHDEHEHEHDVPGPPHPPGAGGAAGPPAESYAAQLTAIFILEFGIVFHSVLIGLTLAVSGDEFRTLYAVLVFHQTFEGLGLGSRLAVVAWPRAPGASKKSVVWTPYILAVAYGLSTPVALGIGLGFRYSLVMEGATALLVQGSFDSISAGILIYTGLVELMAHEFMFSGIMRRARLRVVLAAFGTMCLGAGLMALLGKWA